MCLAACAKQTLHSALAVKTHVLVPQAESAALPNQAQRRPPAGATRFARNGAAGGSLVRFGADACYDLHVQTAQRTLPLVWSQVLILQGLHRLL